MVQGRLAKQWQSYARAVLRDVPADTPQYVESRRTFMAGAHGVLRVMMQGLEPGVEPTMDDLQMMDEIAAELIQFADDVRAGQA